MQFFEEQKRLQRITLRLFALYAMAVMLSSATTFIGLLVIIPMLCLFLGGLVPIFPHFFPTECINFDLNNHLHWNLEIHANNLYHGVLSFSTNPVFLTFMGCYVGAICIWTLYKLWTAENDLYGVLGLLNARLITLETSDADEKKLLNVVEEMSLAAGICMPDVFIISSNGINAMAGGLGYNNTIIAVTDGAIKNLPREQLQGIVAHEFSHIISQDTRINVYINCMLGGLMFLDRLSDCLLDSVDITEESTAGAFSIKDGIQNRFGGAILFSGIFMKIVAFPQAFFGKWMCGKISRSREFLADAFAVQFTRNPEGLAGALDRISRLPDAHVKAGRRADFYSHMFFLGMGREETMRFKSHPTNSERIQRILPHWVVGQPVRGNEALANETHQRSENLALDNFEKGQQQKREKQESQMVQHGEQSKGFFANSAVGLAAISMLGQVGNVNANNLSNVSKSLNALPEPLKRALECSYSARALIYAMLINNTKDEFKDKQLTYLAEHADAGVYDLTAQLIPLLAGFPTASKLPLVQLTIPALRQLSKPQYDRFVANITAVCDANGHVDGHLSLFEWCIQAIVLHALMGHFYPRKRALLSVGGRQTEMAYALTMLAQAGEQDPRLAFDSAVEKCNLSLQYDERPFDSQTLFEAMEKLARLSAVKKEQLAHAMVACVSYNHRIDNNEVALLSAYLFLLDCPACHTQSEDIGALSDIN